MVPHAELAPSNTDPRRHRGGHDRPVLEDEPGVATAAELYGERDSGKEERLELRAVSGRGRARQVPGQAAGNFPGTG
jgi:hypothetical protein